MIHDKSAPARRLRRCPLMAGLGLALALAAPTATAAASPQTPQADREQRSLPRDAAASRHGSRRADAPRSAGPLRPAESVAVTNCGDSGPGSLRAALDAAVDGDTVDLRQLAPCTISLQSGLFILADNLRILGPDRPGEVTIDGSSANGMFAHVGDGRLQIDKLTIANGKYSNDHDVNGGCVYSTGDVELTNVVISGCSTYAQGGAFAMGGGVFALGRVVLDRSAVQSSIALAGDSGLAFGGGVYAGGGLQIFASTISGNLASAVASGRTSYGGGAWSVLGNNTIDNSTVSGNSAAQAGGLALYGYDFQTRIVQSTISGNESSAGASGLHVGSGSISIRNSTITVNAQTYSDGSGTFAGLEIPAALAARLDSNIIAGNVVEIGSYRIPYDFFHGDVPVIGSANLASGSAAVLPTDTLIVLDARLGPLAANGGSTLTHVPLPDSPAIGRGNNLQNLTFDQRGAPREFGRADIGSVEVVDRVFEDGFELTP